MHAGPYTQEEMCDLIPRLYRGSIPAHVFFDAQDRGPFGTTVRKKRFYNFYLEKEVAGGVILLNDLGSLFKGFTSGSGYYTEQHSIYFQDAQRPNGRVLTKVFSFPKKVSPQFNESTWAIYKLCRKEVCRENPSVTLGEWELMSDFIDTVKINFGDVLALYFSDSRKPPTLECLPAPIGHFEGPFHRQ